MSGVLQNDVFPLYVALADLTPNQRLALLERELHGRTFADIGRDMGVSRERVRQLHRTAKFKVETALEAQ